MDNWVVMARVLSISQLKQIVTKKGKDSSILTVTIGDKSGTIDCVMYNEVANKFEQVLAVDEIYEI